MDGVVGDKTSFAHECLMDEAEMLRLRTACAAPPHRGRA